MSSAWIPVPGAAWRPRSATARAEAPEATRTLRTAPPRTRTTRLTLPGALDQRCDMQGGRRHRWSECRGASSAGREAAEGQQLLRETMATPRADHPRKSCTVDSCRKAAVAFELCPRHYRWRQEGRVVCAIEGCGKVALTGKPLCRGHTAAKRECSIASCGQRAHARGLCMRHYKADRRPTCGRPGCERRASRRGGLCQTCYDADRLSGRECTVAGCERRQKARGWCAMHYNRWLINGGPGEAQPRREYGAGFVDVHGYRMISVDGKARREHHVVMEQLLGRRVRAYETVHHRNGLRADKRPENLELWAFAHPPGARVEDLVDWVVSEYTDRVRQRLADSSAR
jgi:hypothetical protein